MYSLIATLTVSDVAAAQQSKAPPRVADVTGATATECKSDATRWYNDQWRNLSDSVETGQLKALDFRAINNRRTSQLRTCLSKIDTAALQGAGILRFAEVLAEVRDDERALSMAKQYLALPSLTDAERLDAVLSMIARFPLLDRSAMLQAEPYVAMLDAMPSRFILQKIRTHEERYRHYQTLEDEHNTYKHALAIIDLARDTKAHMKSADAPDVPAGMIDGGMLLAAYTAAATVDGNQGREADGRKLLARLDRDHPEIDAKYTRATSAPILARYALVGKPAKAIASTRWINAAPETRNLVLKGAVTVLGFTAHWCQPCHLTYAPMQRLADSLQDRGVRVAFATEFYGFVGRKTGLDEPQEIAATREYYDARGVKFPIALLGNPLRGARPNRSIGNAFLEHGIQQIPQTLIIDRRGIVRRVLIGWDPANSERLPAYIDTLLREK